MIKSLSELNTFSIIFSDVLGGTTLSNLPCNNLIGQFILISVSNSILLNPSFTNL